MQLRLKSQAMTAKKSINQWIYKSLGYDPEADLQPVGLVGQVANVMVVNPSAPWKTARELFDYGLANPEKLNFASAGIGSTGHLLNELIATRLGMKLVHIPYKGMSLAVSDLIGVDKAIKDEEMGDFIAEILMPVKTVKEFVELAKAKPGTLNYSSAGIGSSSHLAPELLAMMTGINIVHVPYKGGGPGLVDLLSGQMQFMMTTTPAAMPHVKSGKIRALGVTSAKRSQSLPDLPTIAEAGVKGYEVSTWYGVLAPAKTSKAIVTKLHGEIIRLIAVPDTKEKLLSQGFEPVGSTPEEFGAYIKSEIAKWAKVIKTAKIKAE